MKRAFDLFVSAAALILLAPLLALLAVAVRVSSPGPVLYRSRRAGRGGRPFDLFKLRTMKVGAPDVRNSDGSTFNAADDPRLTPVGAWLRRTSLDELPQLMNVLRGEMSLVGPRPDLVDQVDQYVASHRRRLDVRPGITGLAQVSGRNELSLDARRELDVRYVETRTFWMDLRILARTFPVVLHAHGVYLNDRSKIEKASRHG